MDKKKRRRRKLELWPAMGLQRLAQYYRHRVGRMAETPYAIAAGFASGVAISFTPFLGFHLLLGGMMTWALRGSMLAMVIGTLAGNPWTTPFIWVMTYKTGKFMMGEAPRLSKVPEPFVFTDLLDRPADLLLPMTLGCIPYFIVGWGIAFYAGRHFAVRYKAQRQARIRGGRKDRK